MAGSGKGIFAWLPRVLPKRLLTGFLNAAAIFSSVSDAEIRRHANNNAKFETRHRLQWEKTAGYIENQNHCADLAVGKKDAAYCGCGAIAVYNACLTLETERVRAGEEKHGLPALSDLLSEFELDGLLFSGRLGIAPGAIMRVLEKRGYRTQLCRRRSEWESFAEGFTSLILLMYNNSDDIRERIHYIHIAHVDGKYQAHNVTCDGQVMPPVATWAELKAQVAQGRAKGICLIGVKG